MSTPPSASPDPITGAVALGPAESRALLERVLGEARQPRAVVVFDLDSTLLDNSPRQARIMREYAAEVGLEPLARVQAEHWKGWDLRVPMAAVGLDAATIDQHAGPFKDYWRERFFTSDYCVDDRAIAGAPEYTRAVAEVARLCYVTGRHELMRRGSIASFTACGFPAPDGDRIDLLMKPTLDESDDAYKLRTYATLRGHGVLVAAFDNEPAHINGYKEAFPTALVVHLATDHSMRNIRVAEGITSISDFSSWL
jgi:hypothetical protein